MSSPNTDLQKKIAQAKQDVNEAAKRTSESRQRADSTRNSPPLSGGSGTPTSNDNGRTGAAGMAGAEKAGGTRATGEAGNNVQTRSELGPVDEEASDSENDNMPTPTTSRSIAPSEAAQSSKGKEPRRQPQAPNPNPGNQTKPNAGASGRSRSSIPVLDEDLTTLQAELLRELTDINVQDSYDALAAGVGKLKRDEYLALPVGFTLRNIAPDLVGKPAAHAHFNMSAWAQIYALNKARAPEGADAKIFALLRLEAVKCGWIDGQREIVFLDPVPNALRILAEDMSELRDRAATIKMASFLVPLIAEHVFRTYGHHFISTDAANYTDRYNLTLKSCLAPDAVGLLPPAVYFHAALHWVSPGRAWRVLQAQKNSTNMPDALRIRANAAPAGTAILTTTAAILESMESVQLAHLFQRHGGYDINQILTVTAAVKQDPPRYHKSYFAYGVPDLTSEERAVLEAAKQTAIRFAPFAQAYINTYMRDAALGKAQALKKHAEQNPVQMRRAQNLFRAIVRKDVLTVEDLFIAQLGTSDMD